MNPKIMVIDAHPVYALRTIGFLESLTLKNNLLQASGIRALEAVIENEPDAIILSAVLPDADSLQLARQIRQERPSLEIIVQTGLLTDDETIKKFKSLGLSYVIPRLEKDWTALQEAVTAIISLKAA